MLEGRLLRYGAPALYNRMAEVFSTYQIHPYEVHGIVIKNENGFDVSLTFTADFSQSCTQHFSFEQVRDPDEGVTRFFEMGAEKCKSLLIADYYKMMRT